MTKKDFDNLGLKERVTRLKDGGDYIACRKTAAHTVYLYSFDGHFIEVYIITGLNNVQWVEIQSNQSILNEYAMKVDLTKLF
jgi:hypothetical protein